MNDTGLNSIEKKASVSLAAVFGMRMIGLFMILPVFAIYGVHLKGYSPIWLGLAIGAYGFTQALLQIPMGMLSDKFGRKPIIISGLIIFCIGSLVAALSDSVYGVVVGRALQGMGAIASATLALAADLSREEQRPKVMATIGMFIGLSFAAAMVLGPLVAGSYGLSGLFYLTAILAVVGIVLVIFVVPSSINVAPKGDHVAIWDTVFKLAKHPELFRLNSGVFILHLALTSMFVSLPLMLENVGFSVNEHWQMYLPTLLFSFVIMIPFMIWAIKKNKEKLVFCSAILLMAVSVLLLWIEHSQLYLMVIFVVMFFTGFNYLEATLPSTLSRIAPAGDKGSAMGIYSSSQFFGAFFGGVAGGLIQSKYDLSSVFLFSTIVLLIWFGIAQGMKHVKKSKSLSFNVDFTDEAHAIDLASQLDSFPGVIESTIVYSDSVAYLKIDDKVADVNKIKALFA